MNFAQLDAVPDAHLKWTLVILVVILTTGAAIVAAYASLKKRRTIVEPQPMLVEKTPKRFNAQLCEMQHTELNRRLAGHDAEINSIWTTLRSEDEQTRVELRNFSVKIIRSLGRIEGHLGIEEEPLKEL
jgi:hypothetical protein